MTHCTEAATRWTAVAGVLLLLGACAGSPSTATTRSSLSTPVIPPGGMGPGSTIVQATGVNLATSTPKPQPTATPRPPAPATARPPQPTSTPRPVERPAPHPEAQPTAAGGARPTVVPFERYKVVKGDTLYSIARRFGVSLTALEELNGVTNPNTIKIGKTLLIPHHTVIPTQTARR
ncbi:MAG: LysM peptidoglycan-binding domain-containing protein [Chloroflexi bacterium]|nr:LysM peptidoglycan-binding domain-containing protein [Chloroflexota bacterium]